MKLQCCIIQSTTGLKAPLKKKKYVLNFSEFKKTFATWPLFSNVTGLQCRICNSPKEDPPKNVSCGSSKIVGNLPGKGLY